MLVKVKINKSGIYHFTFDELVNMGIEHPGNVKIYGNRAYTLKEFTQNGNEQMLVEIPLDFNLGDDNVFNSGDYVMFYGEGTEQICFNSDSIMFNVKRNPYSKFNYYFITEGDSAKLVHFQEDISTPETQLVECYDSILHYEKDKINLAKLGRNWYGEVLDSIDNLLLFKYQFDNALLNNEISLDFDFAIRNNESGLMQISVNGEKSSLSFERKYSVYQYGYSYSKTINYSLDSATLDIEIKLLQSNAHTQAWLNYFTIRIPMHLKYFGNQMPFRNVDCIGTDEISKFVIDNVTSDMQVWNISNPLNPCKVNLGIVDAKRVFKVKTDSLVEFVAFDKQNLMTPEIISEVRYNNLINLPPADYIIISHPELLEAAYNLAAFHVAKDNFSTQVVDVQDVYNNFSSGKTDPSAIRNFILHQNKTSPIKYVVILGAATYDSKNLLEKEGAFIPSYISSESLQETKSLATDDYFVQLNDADISGTPDIAIGRIPARNIKQANNYIDKLKNYYAGSSFGFWRNNISFIADDEDANIHLLQSEIYANTIDTVYREKNISKIYFAQNEQHVDSVMNEGGWQYNYSYPEATYKIRSVFEKGSLVINYIGHSLSGVWGNENVLSVENYKDINNINNLPFLMSFSCGFAKFDDPELEQSGEDLLFMDNGGVIGLFAASRVCYSGANFQLGKHVFQELFESNTTLGNVFIQAKQDSNEINDNKFQLLGDPALELAKPEYQVITDKFNGEIISTRIDTLLPGGSISVNGFIADAKGIRQQNFNGKVNVELYNKHYFDTTLENSNTQAQQIQLQGSLIDSKIVEIINGEFTVIFDLIESKNDTEFICGKLSYYAYSNNADAGGYFDGFVISGFPNSIMQQDSKNELVVYPNPFNESVTFKLPNEGSYQLIVTDFTGKVLKVIKSNNVSEMVFFKDDLKAGVYFYQLTNVNGEKYSGKIMIQ